ncbi:MAG TPA: DUF2937 family protein [Marinagarivorans sp.]
MISGIVDKLVFGAVLLAFFQLPILADHYQQYLTGYFDATHEEVEKINAMVVKHQYADTEALIASHQKSSIASVRQDADNKKQLLIRYKQLSDAVALFERGTLADKVTYMLNPSRHETLQRVVSNFEPGIPLSPHYLLLCALAALGFNALAASPAKAVRHIRKKRRKVNKINEKPVENLPPQ